MLTLKYMMKSLYLPSRDERRYYESGRDSYLERSDEGEPEENIFNGESFVADLEKQLGLD